jgi:hypothetical protein
MGIIGILGSLTDIVAVGFLGSFPLSGALKNLDSLPNDDLILIIDSLVFHEKSKSTDSLANFEVLSALVRLLHLWNFLFWLVPYSWVCSVFSDSITFMVLSISSSRSSLLLYHALSARANSN